MPAAHAASATEYLAVRGKTNVTPLESTQALTSQFLSRSGQVVELQGTVAGILDSDLGAGYLLRVDQNQTLVIASQQKESDVVLGSTVRALVRVKSQGAPESLSVTSTGPMAPELARADLASLRGDNPSTTASNAYGQVQSLPGYAPAISPQSQMANAEVPIRLDNSSLPMMTPQESQPARNAQVYYDNAQGNDGVLYDGSGWAMNDAVERYAGKIQEVNSRLDADTAHKIAFHLVSKSQQNGVDPLLSYSLICQESRFNPRAVSPVGAQGLGQLMPGTAASLGVRDSFDIEENLDGTIRYIAQQMRAFDGNHSMALAAYNAGPGAVKRYGGVPPYRETQNYVKKIWSMYSRMSAQNVAETNYN